jgi:hypothetical protein
MSNKNTIWVVIGIILVIVVALNYSKISSSLNKTSFSSVPQCGNYECESGENYSNCPVDCPFNCNNGEKVQVQCGEGWAFNWYSKQCVDGTWLDIENQNPCFCASDSYCQVSKGYKCINNVCALSVPKTCGTTFDCGGAIGFYCDSNHTCQKCTQTYSLFSIYDCQYSEYSCVDANHCYDLTNDYCVKWLCQNNQCIDNGKRFDGCCNADTDCQVGETCSSHLCSKTPVKKASPLNFIITILVIAGIGVGGYFLFKKFNK